MKITKKRWISLGIAFALICGMLSPLAALVGKAASCAFSMSGATVNVGDTFTLSLSCSWEGADLLTYSGSVSYDPSYLELISGDLNIAESDGFKEESYTFKALKAGSTSVSYNPAGDAYGETATEPIVVMSCSSSGGEITILEPTVAPPPATEPPATEPPATEPPAPPATEAPEPPAPPVTDPPATEPPTTAAPLSGNARLEALSIYPGTLSPAFSPDVFIYETTVENSVAKLSVSAVTADVDATYLITDTNLKVGRTIIDIKVTAANGSVEWYTIRVNRKAEETTAASTEAPTTAPATTEEPTQPETSAENPLEVTIGTATAYVQESLGEVARPEGFDEIVYNFRGVEVEALKGLGKNLLLLPVSDGTGTRLYLYNETNGGFYPYVGIQITSALFTVLPFDAGEKAPEGYRLSVINFDGALVDAWVRTDVENDEFALFYAMNWDGQTALYRYDTKEQTLQRVNKEELSHPETHPEESSAETEQTQGSNNGTPDVADQNHISYYENLIRKINRRDTILFIISVVLLICLIAMYLLFSGDRKNSPGDPDNDPDDDADDEEDDDAEDDSEESLSDDADDVEDDTDDLEDEFDDDLYDESDEDLYDEPDEDLDEDLENGLDEDLDDGRGDESDDLSDGLDAEDDELDDRGYVNTAEQLQKELDALQFSMAGIVADITGGESSDDVPNQAEESHDPAGTGSGAESEKAESAEPEPDDLEPDELELDDLEQADLESEELEQAELESDELELDDLELEDLDLDDPNAL